MKSFERIDRKSFEPLSLHCNFVGTALAIGLGIAGAASSIGTAAIGAHAAGQAADAQVNAANSAAQLSHADNMAALDFQKQQYADQQKNTQPWITAGQGAISQLSNDMASGRYGDFNEKFTAPTGAEAAQDPGYQFRLQQGMKALQASASARGGLLTGGTAKALDQYGQDYASNEYSNVYGRRFNEYQNRFNVFNTNQTNDFNRWASVAGAGQQANTAMGQQGQATSNNVANIYSNDASQVGNAIQNAGAARASGYVGAANAWGGAFSGLGSLALLGALNKK